MVKFDGVPAQPFRVGVTAIVPVMGVDPPFVPTKVAMLPDPPAPKPIAVFEFVHVNVEPAGVLVNAAGETLPPHCAILAGTFATGVGLTVITYVSVTPIQPFNVGVTTIEPVSTVDPALVAVKLGWFPVPDAPNPIAVFEFVQPKVAPAGVLVNAEEATVPLLHAVKSGLASTDGVGKMEMV